MSWALVVILICLLLAIGTTWLEYKRADKRHLIWRIIASLVAVIMLACIILPVGYRGNSAMFGNNDAALLTENFSADSVKHAGYKKVYTLDRDIKKAYPGAILLTDLQNIDPAIKQLRILGYGLDNTDLKQLRIPVIYNPLPPPNGFQSVNWQQYLKTGDVLKIQGRYNNTSTKPIKLVLQGLNTTLDSVAIEAGKIADFELTTIPKITGRATYTLLALSGKDTIKRETIPFSVGAAKPIKVLILSASPDFESKFLKDWLATRGFSIASRAAISKDKISQDYVNMDKEPLDHLSANLLNKFDLVIGDLSTLKSLSSAENITLKQQVEQNGLGIIVRADSAGKTASWLDNNFRVNTFSTKPIAVSLFMQGKKTKTMPLNIDPASLSDNSAMQNLVSDAKNHVLSGVTQLGQGKLVFTLLNSTYTWALNGAANDYASFWSLLISKATRKLSPIAEWSVPDGMTTVNQSVGLQLQSGIANPSITIDNARVSAEQSPLAPFNRNFYYWPSKPGWFEAIIAGTDTSWAYAYQKNDWKAIKILKKMADTKKYSDNRGIIATAAKQTDAGTQNEVPKGLFYITLLLACTFLWAERRFTV